MRVFISSTPDELELYQAAACDVAHSLGMEPVVRDPTAGRGRDQVAACDRQMATADLLLVIVGWRRGRVPAPELGGDGLHPWTFWEVRSAFEHRKPVRVLMAGENWRPDLREEDSRGWAVMQDLRAELRRLAVLFDDETGTGKAASSDDAGFSERLRQQLLAARQGLPAPGLDSSEDSGQPPGLEPAEPSGKAPAEPSGEIPAPAALQSPAAQFQARLRIWPPAQWPERPYPLLLPYTHPDLLAGRDLELAELRQLLRRRVPILGMHATSGTGKSSLLRAALVPILRVEGHPVAFDRQPHQPGLDSRLLDDLLEVDGRDVAPRKRADAPDHAHFIERLLEVVGLAGEVPILVLDQFEELFRGDDRHDARAKVGTLLAASMQQQPGLQGLPCRWLLAYRREFHGQVSSWLGDVLREARHERLPGTAHLPHDLSGLERFHDWPLPIFGGRHGRIEDDSVDSPEPRLRAARQAFQSAIEKPLVVRSTDGERLYRWRFAEGGAERLARAFAEARLARPDAPLVPELQVVLGHLLEQTGAPNPLPPNHPSTDVVESVVEVPEDAAGLIDQALEQHLRRALDAACSTGERTDRDPSRRLDRTRALLALLELADVEGRRLAGLPAAELAQAIGSDGHEVLERMATPETRLVVLENQDGGFRYSLSHDRMAEVIVRAVGEQGRSFDLAVDSELVALRRFVVLRSELYRSGQVEQATAIPRRHYRRVAEHSAILLWGGDRQRWWQACLKRRQQERRWATLRRAIAVAALGLVGLGAWSWVDQRERRRALFDQVAAGDPEIAFATLDQLAAEGIEEEELLAVWRQREQPFDVFGRGLGGVDAQRRGEAVLRLAELANTLLSTSPEDPVRLASLLWALDFFTPPSERARQLRNRALGPLRQRRPPPPIGDLESVEIPAGNFRVGTTPAQVGNASEPAAERVRIPAFRVMIHEVTEAQYRLLMPGHDPGRADDLPVARINWYEAYTYAAWLGGRLPSTAECQYAAHASCAFVLCRRDGSEAAVSEVAWWLGTSEDPQTHEPAAQSVMQLEANPWGLFDVYGNVWEWTADWSVGADQPRVGKAGPTRGTLEARERCAGSAWEPAEMIRPSGYGASEVVLRSSQIGLRVVFSIGDP